MDKVKIEIVQENDLENELKKARNLNVTEQIEEQDDIFLLKLLKGFWMRTFIGFRAIVLIGCGIAVCFTGIGLIWIILNFLRILEWLPRYKGGYVTFGTFFSSILLVIVEITIFFFIIAH